jgi:hypothetical protein
MIMRITWGKLRAGTWQEYEQAYHEMVAGKAVPGLRGRWLAQDGSLVIPGVHILLKNKGNMTSEAIP